MIDEETALGLTLLLGMVASVAFLFLLGVAIVDFVGDLARFIEAF